MLKHFFFHWEKPSVLCCKKCHQILNANVFSSSNVHSHFSFIIVLSRLSPGSLEQSLPASVTTKHTLRLNNTENDRKCFRRELFKTDEQDFRLKTIKLHDKMTVRVVSFVTFPCVLCLVSHFYLPSLDDFHFTLVLSFPCKFTSFCSSFVFVWLS